MKKTPLGQWEVKYSLHWIPLIQRLTIRLSKPGIGLRIGNKPSAASDVTSELSELNLQTGLSVPVSETMWKVLEHG